MNVLYQCDEKYAGHMGISLTTLLIHNVDCEFINVFILDAGIGEENKEKIRQTCTAYGRNCFFIDGNDIIVNLKNSGILPYRNSYATFMKLYIKEKLPENIDRILYIDCDTVILKKLDGLFSVKMEGKPLAMCEDIMAYQYKRKLGFEKEETYYNAGIILFDFQTWNLQKWEEKIESFWQIYSEEMMLKHDQDILNRLFKGHIKTLPLRYNMQSVLYITSLKVFWGTYKKVVNYTYESLKKEFEEQTILHFLKVCGESPWDEGNLHPHQQYYEYYKKNSLWKDESQTVSNISMIYKIEKMIYRRLPAGLFLWFFKFIHDIFHII